MSKAHIGYGAVVKVTVTPSRFVMIPWFEELAELSWCVLPPGRTVIVPNPNEPPASSYKGSQHFVNHRDDCTMMVVERPSFPQEIVAAAEAVREDGAKAFMLHDALLERGWDGMAKAVEDVTVECDGCEGNGKIDRTVWYEVRLVQGIHKTSTNINSPCQYCSGTGKRARPDYAKLKAVLTVILGELIVPIGPLSGIGR